MCISLTGRYEKSFSMYPMISSTLRCKNPVAPTGDTDLSCHSHTQRVKRPTIPDPDPVFITPTIVTLHLEGTFRKRTVHPPPFVFLSSSLIISIYVSEKILIKNNTTTLICSVIYHFYFIVSRSVTDIARIIPGITPRTHLYFNRIRLL